MSQLIKEVKIVPLQASLRLEWGLTVNNDKRTWNWPNNQMDVRMYLNPFPSFIGKPELLNMSLGELQETFTSGGSFQAPFFEISLGREVTHSAFRAGGVNENEKGRFFSLHFNLVNDDVPPDGTICFPSVRWPLEIGWLSEITTCQIVFGHVKQKKFISEYDQVFLLKPEDLPTQNSPYDQLEEAIKKLSEIIQEPSGTDPEVLKQTLKEEIAKMPSVKTSDITDSMGIAIGSHIQQTVIKGMPPELVERLINALERAQKTVIPHKPKKVEVFRKTGHIFISYAREDGLEIAKWLYDSLEANNIAAWRDENDLDVYRDMSSELEKAIESASYVVVLATADVAREDSFVRLEISYAKKVKTPIIPLLLPDGHIPITIENLTYIDFTDCEQGFSELLARINKKRLVSTPGRHLFSGLPELISPLDTPEWLPIQGGRFILGSNDILDAEAHEVNVDNFYIARTPVTQQQYARFIRLTGHDIPYDDWYPEYCWDKQKLAPPEGKLDHPVVLVSVFDAEAYCEWLTEELRTELCKIPGSCQVALPSEAEWEYAVRTQDQRPYPWGIGAPSKTLCNFDGTGTTPVGYYTAAKNPHGLMDVCGNVWEWTRSAMWDYPYIKEDGREMPNPAEPRVIRGGSWQPGANMETLHASTRFAEDPGIINCFTGFRVIIRKIK